MPSFNVWEYGIAIGVLAILLPTLLWTLQYLLRVNSKAQITLQEHRSEEIMNGLKELIQEMNRLNARLSELTGMLTFILDHYIKTNGIVQSVDRNK